MRFLDLWRWNGRVDRKTFASVGFIGFAVKLVIDRLIERHFLADNTALFFSLGMRCSISSRCCWRRCRLFGWDGRVC